MPRAGRPKSLRVKRDKTTGRSRGEDQIHPESIYIRERQLKAAGIPLVSIKHEGGRQVEKRTATDKLSGFTLGVLFLRYQADKSDPGSINREQYEAGEAWAGVVHRHAAVMGYKLSVPSPAFIMVGGSSCGDEPDEQTIARVRRQFTACYDALMMACKDERTMEVRNITYSVCIENKPVNELTESDYGYLRIGLNAVRKGMGQ